jgi:uncharacterized damage-inducible protein DinB
MKQWLQDLFGHQAWADAELWRTIEACEPARTDKAIRVRAHHIHLVQSAFLWVVGDRSAELVISKADDFADLGELKTLGKTMNARLADALARRDEQGLAARVGIPWFQQPALEITVGEALTQCAMHSQWHRGQNATRVRELGGEVPSVDLIVWMWKGRPAASWG